MAVSISAADGTIDWAPPSTGRDRGDQRHRIESIVKLRAVSVCREISEGRKRDDDLRSTAGDVHVLGDRGRYGWRSTM